MTIAAPLEPRESDIQSAVVAHWRSLGRLDTLVAAIPNAYAFGQAGLTPGLPDLLVISPSLAGGVGFIELKADGGTLSEAQQRFEKLCKDLGIPYAVTYGRDAPIHMLERWGAVRKMKWPK